MLNIGPSEMVVIGIIVLLAVGPEQLPGVLRKVGNAVSQIRSATEGLKADFMAGIEEIENAADLDNLSAKIVDPFNPATFEAQSKISNPSTKEVSSADGKPSEDGPPGDGAFDDSAYADRPKPDRSVEDDKPSNRVDPLSNTTSDAGSKDESGSAGAVVADGAGQSSHETGVDTTKAEVGIDVEIDAASKLKADAKREQAAAVVEAMRAMGDSASTGAGGADDEKSRSDAPQPDPS